MFKEREEILRGSIIGITYQNPDNGYSILRLNAESGETVTVVGLIPLPMIGEKLLLTGKWITHPSYGKQFEAQFLERAMPETKLEILSFLSSRAIKGIGARIAERIVDEFGTESLDVIENDPNRLAEIPGISVKKAMEIAEEFRKQTGIRTMIEYLTSHNLPAEIALHLYRLFGTEALKLVRQNPYMMADPEIGADFASVDAFAMELGLDGDDPRRIEAGILFELSYNLNNGHVFLPKEKLCMATVQLLNLSTEEVISSLERLITEERLVSDRIANLDVCYLPELYEAETYVCGKIRALSEIKDPVPGNLAALLAKAEARQGITFAEAQREAMRAAAENRLMLLTGGPGTGKTTTLGGILSLFDMLHKKTQLAAPTGRAAKRLSELTGREAATIHRMLEVQYSEETGQLIFAHDEEDPLDADALIVDETSMVDIRLMESLLHALPEKCKLIMVGDPDQLPSVGPGNLFSDLIRSKKVMTVCLTEIFRQARESLIVMNAHAVNHGEMPVLTVKNKDFFFLKRMDFGQAVETIRDLCARRLPVNMGISVEDIQVLSPTRKYETGTTNLNRVLQNALNPAAPEKKEKVFRDYVFREGDRVMQVRNNYDILWKRTDGIGAGTGIFNGDIGHIQSIDNQAETVKIVFDDREAEYTFDMLAELEPAYAMTVHKSQGSEYRAVILAALQGSPLLLTRSILYTAITRAKDILIIVGDDELVSCMVRNNRQSRRYSGLKLRLEKDCE